MLRLRWEGSAEEQRRDAASAEYRGGPDTLYRALSRMVSTGLLEEVDAPTDGDADERRRYYRVTPDGRRAAAAEARRLESRLGAARAHGLLGRA